MKQFVEKNIESTEVTASMTEPFTLVTKNEETKIAVGNTVVSKETFKSKEDAEAYIDSKPWELLINTICFITEMSIKK